jgi:AcrR family transcriptional regulator
VPAPHDRGPGSQEGKRERLVTAACELFHQQGIAATTLADIADTARVPLGNVYYYFKAKNDIVEAVVNARAREITDLGAVLARRHRTPRARLKALVAMVADQREVITTYGCPYGTLCGELVNQDEDSSRALAADLMRSLIAWAEEQFRQMGRRDAGDLAVELVAMYQGGAVIASAVGDPEMFALHARRMHRWIDGIEVSPQ